MFNAFKMTTSVFIYKFTDLWRTGTFQSQLCLMSYLIAALKLGTHFRLDILFL